MTEQLSPVGFRMPEDLSTGIELDERPGVTEMLRGLPPEPFDMEVSPVQNAYGPAVIQPGALPPDFKKLWANFQTAYTNLNAALQAAFLGEEEKVAEIPSPRQAQIMLLIDVPEVGSEGQYFEAEVDEEGDFIVSVDVEGKPDPEVRMVSKSQCRILEGTDNAWQSLPIAHLELNASVTNRLQEYGVANLGVLDRGLKEKGLKFLTTIKGIGEAKARTIVEAARKYAAFEFEGEE